MTDGLASSVLARVAAQRQLVQAMNEHCRSISARVSSRENSVSVEVDGFGAMTGLWLARSAYKHGADELAALIVATANAAAMVALNRQRFLLNEFAQRQAELQTATLIPVGTEANADVPC